MSTIALDGLEKKYGANTVVKDINLAIATGEFVTLLGPSGSGKTTTLRMIAGLERSTAGSIRIGGRLVSSPTTFVPTYRRRLGMVFQSYAIWPHKTVAENVAFPLEQLGVNKAARQPAVDAVLAKVGLEGYAGRFPSQLSGGQQQRVALARAIVGKPEVILFDEPLSNLDAQLRESMRELLGELHRDLGITSVYVTHDQAEAMVLSDRICIMSEGRLLQVDTPEALYNRPGSLFVAKFIGHANIFPIKGRDDQSQTVRIGEQTVLRVAALPPQPAENVVMIRPHRVRFARPEHTVNLVEGVLTSAGFLGDRVHLVVDLGGGCVVKADIIAGDETIPQPGTRVRLFLPPADCVVL